MATSQSAEEVKNEFLETFPVGTGELAHELWTNIARLHLTWNNYRALYGTSKERIVLLNWAAPNFFGLLDGILFHNVILAIARLTDPAKTGKWENASFATLIGSLSSHEDSSVIAGWESKLEELTDFSGPVRSIRNRKLAHDDLETALYHRDPIPGVSRKNIEDTLKRMRDFFGAIEGHYRGLPTSHEYVISSGDGEYLMSMLARAHECEGIRERYFENGFDYKPEGK